MEKKREESSFGHGLPGAEIKVVIAIVVFLLNFISPFAFAEPYYPAGHHYPPCQKSDSEISEMQMEAQQGVAQVQLELGKEYLKPCLRQSGEIVNENSVEAARWFQKAADQGLAEAKYRLWRLYSRDRGVNGDEKSLELLKESAEEGFADAQEMIGSSYLNGWNGSVKDGSLAALWFEKAARQGHVGAMKTLGAMYKYGIQIKADLKKAIQWYRQASGTGDSEAMRHLEDIFFEGAPDPVTDQELAALCRKTSDLGEGGAYKLGVLYEQGRGVEKDLKVAYMWYTVAGPGWVHEWERKKALSRFLTQEQIHEAEFKAQEYSKEHPAHIEY